MTASPQITQLLEAVGRGSRKAVDDLWEVVYQDLRQIAALYLRREQAGATIQPTALVHEAYIRLVGQSTIGWHNRVQFFGVAAKVMRRILVDRSRARKTEKRGGHLERCAFDQVLASYEERAIDLVALDEAMSRLADLDERKCRVVEMRFFGGMSFPEIADCLEIPLRTVEREWTTARAWLRADIDEA